MEKYGRGWQRLPSWVGDDRQLIQPGGRPAKGGQMLGFFFTPCDVAPRRRTSSRRRRVRSRRSADLGSWVDRGGEVGRGRRWDRGGSTAGQAFWRSLQIPNATTPASNKARLPGSGTAAILATRKPSL